MMAEENKKKRIETYVMVVIMQGCSKCGGAEMHEVWILYIFYDFM